MHNLLEILIFTLRNFIKLPVLRYLHYIYGISGPSLLIESTDSMIFTCCTCTLVYACVCFTSGAIIGIFFGVLGFIFSVIVPLLLWSCRGKIL